MATAAVFSNYDGKEEMSSYLERFSMFLQINNVPIENHVGYLLTYIGPEAYKVLKDLCVPDLPSTKTYEQLVALLLGHYMPMQLASVERMKFRHRRQETGESIMLFIHALKSASKACAFGANLNENLRDQFIYGLSDNRIARQLLAKDNLTFERACELALQTEVALKESTWILGQSGVCVEPRPSQSVNAVIPGKGYNRKRQEKSGASANGHSGSKCFRCGAQEHMANECPRASYTCRNCQKLGHLAKMCRSSKVQRERDVPRSQPSQPGRRVNHVRDAVEESAEEVGQLFLNNIQEGGNKPLFKELVLNKIKMTFEVDCGASVTVLSEKQWQDAGSPALNEIATRLNAANKSAMSVVGEAKFQVHTNGSTCVGELRAIVVKDNLRYPLLGRPWLDVLYPCWRKVLTVNNVTNKANFIEQLKERFKVCFTHDASSIKGYKANVVLKEGAVPVFQKSYSIPYAIKDKVNKEIQRLVQVGTFVPVTHSEWASPIVVVKKPNGDIRLCCDYKRTVNPQLLKNVYPLPTIEDIFATMPGSTVFCVIDLYQAYMQLEVGDESTKYLVVNTPCGLMKVTKLPYGVASAPLIFQSVMDRILEGIEGVKIYQDDVLVGGSTLEECQKRVVRVFERLAETNVKVNSNKCKFFVTECEYLGHELSADGLRPKNDKVQAILDAPTPKNISALKAWLGMLNFYRHFLDNLSEVVHPLTELTQNHVKWKWGREQSEAFSSAKLLLLQSSALTLFNPTSHIVLTCDASSYGIGSVLSIVENEVEKPVMFHSATLPQALQKCSQTEKEAFAIVSAVKKFHKYVFGRKFTIRTDHKALEYIFAPNKNVPAMTAAKLQRWSLFLSAYDYELKFLSGKEISNADGLSRNPLPAVEEDVEVVHGLSVQTELPITAVDIANKSKTDPILSSVIESVWRGWRVASSHMCEERKTYYAIRDELSVEEGVLLRGHRVVVPTALRDKVIDLLHEGHPGVVRTKILARSRVWWPNIDHAIEQKCKECVMCQLQMKGSTELQTGVIWPKPLAVWDRVHIDFFDFEGKKFLLLCDAYSGWLECWEMTKTDAKAVISKLSVCFAVFSLPLKIVCDNGPPFQSSEFQQFCVNNGIQLVHSPPYHAKSNTYAERAVGTMKQVMKKCENSDLSKVLFHVRMTPRASGLSPFEIVFRKAPTTRLSLLYPREKVGCNPIRVPTYNVNENVLVSTKGRPDAKNPWEFGKVESNESPTTYVVRCQNRSRLVHVDFLRKSSVNSDEQEVPLVPFSDRSAVGPPLEQNVTVASEPLPDAVLPVNKPVEQLPDHTQTESEPTPVGPVVVASPVGSDRLSPNPTTPMQLRRSTRVRVAPARLNL